MIPQTVIEIEKGATRFWDALFTSFIIVVIALALWQSRNFGYRAGLFPWTIGFPLLALAIAQLCLELTGKAKRTVTREGETAEERSADVVLRRTTSIVSWILGVLLLIWLLGFNLAVPVTMLLYLKLTGQEKWPITVIFTFVTWAFFYGLFVYSLNIPFPAGRIFEWLT